MKILIINQHSKNHGDEAAGLALIQNLNKNGFTNISVSYNMDYPWNHKCELNSKGIKNLKPIKFNKYSYRAIILYNTFPNIFTKIIFLLFKDLRFEYMQIKNSDFIISAPGGVNLGLYMDPRYLWRLLVANKMKKKYAIYSPSIGPFSINDTKYLDRSIEVLQGASFLSLRDYKSYEYADQFNVKFLKSIDTAFLETNNNIQVPVELNSIISEKYVIIVPNQLYNWHPLFTESSLPSRVDDFFSKLIKTFTSMNLKVVLLPQLFEQGEKNDEDYFQKLKDANGNVNVISTNYSSDIQQEIIKNAEFIIGARYHTIVFAINAGTPFCSLSYEHKMVNMLELLDLKDFSIDINNAFNEAETAIHQIQEFYNNRYGIKKKVEQAKIKANKIASNCFTEFVKSVLS